MLAVRVTRAMIKTLLSSALTLASTLAAAAADADNWPRFHGPNGQGISHAKGIPTRWTEKEHLWNVALPGLGHSSPVVWGEKVFVTAAEEGGKLRLWCLNAADGRKLWERGFTITPFKKNKANSFASATPALDAERVYLAWGDAEHWRVSALDHAGQPVWEHDLGPFVSQHGPGSSPVVHEGRVVMNNVQDGEASFIALDAKTGAVRWKLPRHGGEEGATSYSTPCVFTPAKGKPVLVFATRYNGITAVDPDTGKVAWEYEKAFNMRTVSSPFIGSGLIFGTCGSGGGGSCVTAVRPGDGAGTPAEQAYVIRRGVPYVPTNVAVGDFAWLWNEYGFLTCIHAPTGEPRWQTNVSAKCFSSPIWVEGRLFCAARDGTMVVVKATAERFEELARFPLGEATQATPAVAGGRMFVRTETRLFCVGGGKAAAAASRR